MERCANTEALNNYLNQLDKNEREAELNYDNFIDAVDNELCIINDARDKIMDMARKMDIDLSQQDLYDLMMG